jgi:choline-glycine betaine transporter
MAVICGAVVHMEMHDKAGLALLLDGNDPSKVLFAFLERLPMGNFLIPILLITAFLSFVTTADGNTDTMSNISSKGISPEHTESSMSVKIAWGTLMAVFCWIIVTQFKLDGIKQLSNLGGFPALFLCLGVAVSAIKVMANPKRYDKFHQDHHADSVDETDPDV